ncbi:EF-hand calcium-binding domain-containing protein 14 [Neosynchiropus ocellatus]
MKKRKELNALIGLGDSKRKKTKKGSGHRLLRTEPPGTESESSSEDEFNNMSSGANFGKRSYTQCCSVCYPLFLFIILAACVMACAGLIWMQIALKEDLDSMKEKLHSMESSQKVSAGEIPKLSEDLKSKDRRLEDIENGDKGLNRLWSNLTEMNRKISLLDSAVSHLKANLKSASDLINLPTTVEELQKSVATIGSTLTSVQHDVKTMQTSLETQKNQNEDLKKAMEVTELRKAVSAANKTEEMHHTWTDEQIHLLLSTVADLHHRVSLLENGSKPSSPDSDAGPAGAQPLVPARAAPEDSSESSTPLPGPRTSRHPRFTTPTSKRSRRDAHCAKVFLPGVSLEALVKAFQRAGDGTDSVGLSYRELRNIFGVSTPGPLALQCFDSDGDQRYTLKELSAAARS